MLHVWGLHTLVSCPGIGLFEVGGACCPGIGWDEVGGACLL